MSSLVARSPSGRYSVMPKGVEQSKAEQSRAMPSDSDRLLIQQIRQGDPRAWETLISRYEGRLLAFVQRRLRDRAASEDVVQETFVGFLNSLPNFDDRRELQTYLFTIAAYKLVDHLRKKDRHPQYLLADGAGEEIGRAHV